MTTQTQSATRSGTLSTTQPATQSSYRDASPDAAPPNFGSPDDEAAALHSGCGVFDRSFCDRLVLTGEDRARFLNGQVTCDVKSLKPGEGTYGFLTSLKGRVEAEFTLLATKDELWLDLPPGTSEAVRERLAKYVIVDRVEFSTPERSVLTLMGPKSFDVAESCVAGDLSDGAWHLPDGAWHHVETTVAGRPARVVREPERSAGAAGTDGWSIWCAPGDAPAILEALGEAGAVSVGWQAVERLRMETGRPLYGVDFGDDTFPQETGLEDAVSYTKGCYLGQEVVARIHYRGGVQRHLRRLRLSGPAEVGADLWLDGKKVGTLTSASPSLSGDELLGLAIVHRRAEVGAELDVENAERPVSARILE